MKALGDYIHSKGLKFGIYSSAGFKTCQAFPASLGMEELDAASYAAWGVDYLKYDNCYQDHGLPQTRYGAMKSALQASGRDVFYSLCEWGRENPATWAPGIADSWRISGDIRDEWHSIVERAEIEAALWRYSGPTKGWNDPDMLEVGNGGCNDAEYRSHFSLWAMLKAPLIIGNDIRNFSTPSPQNTAVLEILGNTEVLAVSQDAAGHQARLMWSDTSEILKTSNVFGEKLIATQCASGAAGAYEDSPADQEWVYQSDGTIKSTSTGACLREISFRTAEQLSAHMLPAEALHSNRTALFHSVSTASCDAATKWDVGQYIGGAVVSRDSKLCLEVVKEDIVPVLQGKRVQTGPCQSITVKHGYMDVSEHQAWTAPGGGALRNLYQRQCLTVDRDAMSGLTQEVWVAPQADKSLAVLLLNKGAAKTTMTLDASMLGAAGTQGAVYSMRNLWTHEDLQQTLSSGNSAQFVVESHGVVMLKLTPQ